MRSMFIDSHNNPPKSIQSLELFFGSNKESIVQTPQKSMKTLFYNKKPNNFNNLKRFNNLFLDDGNIETQPRLKAPQKFPINDLFFDKNIPVPYSLDNDVFNSSKNNITPIKKDISNLDLEKSINQKSAKSNISSTKNHNKLIFSSDSIPAISTANTKNLDSLYKEFISNVIIIY